MKNSHTFGVMLSIWVRRLKVKVEPTADPCLLPTSTRIASAGLRNRLVNSTFRWRVDLGGIVTWSPLGTQKSLASWPATRTWYCKGLPLGLLSLTWSERRNEEWDFKNDLQIVYFFCPDLWTWQLVESTVPVYRLWCGGAQKTRLLLLGGTVGSSDRGEHTASAERWGLDLWCLWPASKTWCKWFLHANIGNCIRRTTGNTKGS